MKKQKKITKIEDYNVIYELTYTIIIFILLFNLALNIFAKEYTLEGTIYEEKGKTYFSPNLQKLYLLSNEEYEILEKDDTIYIYYDKKYKSFKYSLDKKYFTCCWKGTVYKKTDYYIYIDFDFKNEITNEVYIREKNFEGNVKVPIKKFFGEYRIMTSAIDFIDYMFDKSYDYVNNNLEEIRGELRNGNQWFN